MLGRQQLRLNGSFQPGAAGYRAMNPRRVYLETTAASMVLTAAHIAAGYVVRSGQAGAIGDTFPSVDSLLAAFPELTRGDSFDFVLVSSTANLNTPVVGAGMTFAGTTTVPASQMRQYLMTLTSEPKRTAIVVANTTNGSAVLSGLSQADLANLGVGMGVSGTGIPASTTILAVNLTAGTVTMSANATATGSLVAVTATPQMEVRGMFTAAI